MFFGFFLSSYNVRKIGLFIAVYLRISWSRLLKSADISASLKGSGPTLNVAPVLCCPASSLPERSNSIVWLPCQIFFFKHFNQINEQQITCQSAYSSRLQVSDDTDHQSEPTLSGRSGSESTHSSPHWGVLEPSLQGSLGCLFVVASWLTAARPNDKQVHRWSRDSSRWRDFFLLIS